MTGTSTRHWRANAALSQASRCACVGGVAAGHPCPGCAAVAVFAAEAQAMTPGLHDPGWEGGR